MPRRGRAVATVLILFAGALWSAPSSAQNPPPPQICSEPDQTVTLFAEELAGGDIGYGLTPETASVPGPTIQMMEGECVAITLVNDANDRVGIHAHGVEYTPTSDGTPLNASCTQPGRSKTYMFQAHAPFTREDGTVDSGSAGYWHYHDHCMGTTHGTGGIKAGLYGAFIVRREGDLVPDRPPFVVVMNGISINNRQAPKTPVFKANLGERVEFVVIGHGELFHTFHLHAHRWVANRTGYVRDVSADVPLIDTRTLGPADSFGFQVIAGEGVGPGAWFYHCHVQGHSDNGMSGLFYVRNADGTPTAQQQAALKRWKSEHVEGHH